ncbi:class A beta-lactamase [Nocardia callitridis]|uniref:Beta-lactamase n=1 Tax=Nocardia callitridis TaxID=648753 RepID=A0ABP9JYX1_9NOCA
MARNRRAVFVTVALLLPLLAGCGASSEDAATPAASVSEKNTAESSGFADLEQKYDAQLGLFAIDTANGKTVGNRADERFPILSTFKTLAAGALLKAHPLDTGYFDKVIHYTEQDVVANSPVTSVNVAQGVTVAQLAEAAITQSDNTAGNLMLRELGGPQALTDFLRSIGDQVSHLDRWETELNTAIPGDERDTSTPTALASDYRALVLGDVLAAPEREQLITWLKANTTGDARIRAGLPTDWVTGDKTGTGDYGTANAVAVTWPEGGRAPIVIAIQTRKSTEDAEANNALLADATKIVVEQLK